MELDGNMGSRITSNNNKEEDQDDVPLPGFRFHPTDEELVGFYLRRKVEKRPISIELIKQADIYKYDPWDLPKSSNVGDKEWYFFCKRGRKYRNSIRPNRVTGSGFWKATGIDRPIYSSSCTGEAHRDCIGLKKSLVYYRGSAGKGTKTNWMMHEFRLPSTHDKVSTTKAIMDAKTIVQEAEVWTLCRILKRDVSYRNCTPETKRIQSNNTLKVDASSQSCSMDSSDQNQYQNNYISFSASVIRQRDEKPHSGNVESGSIANQHEFLISHFSSSAVTQSPSSTSSFSSSPIICADMNELLVRQADWEDLRSIVDYSATNPFRL